VHKSIPFPVFTSSRALVFAALLSCGVVLAAPTTARAAVPTGPVITIGDGSLTSASSTTVTYTVIVTDDTAVARPGSVVATIPITSQVERSVGGALAGRTITWPLKATTGNPQTLQFTVKMGEIPSTVQRVVASASVFEGSKKTQPISNANDYDVNTGYKVGSTAGPPVSAPATPSSGSPAVWVVPGILVVAAAGAASFFFLRRRLSGMPDGQSVWRRRNRKPEGASPVGGAE